MLWTFLRLVSCPFLRIISFTRPRRTVSLQKILPNRFHNINKNAKHNIMDPLNNVTTTTKPNRTQTSQQINYLLKRSINTVMETLSAHGIEVRSH